MLFQEVKDPLQGRCTLDVLLALVQQDTVALLRRAFGLCAEDVHHRCAHLLGFWLPLCIVTAPRLLQIATDLLFGVEQALVMLRLREHLGDDRSVVAAQVGDHHLRVIALASPVFQGLFGLIAP